MAYVIRSMKPKQNYSYIFAKYSFCLNCFILNSMFGFKWVERANFAYLILVTYNNTTENTQFLSYISIIQYLQLDILKRNSFVKASLYFILFFSSKTCQIPSDLFLEKGFSVNMVTQYFFFSNLSHQISFTWKSDKKLFLRTNDPLKEYE